MSPISRILNLLVSPLVPIIGAVFSSEVEKLVALAEIDQHEELEDRARQLEAEGKSHLAARLRQRASVISSDCPGQYGNQIIGQLSADCKQVPDSPVAALQGPTETAEGDTQPGNAHPRPRRRGRRKTGDSPETSES